MHVKNVNANANVNKNAVFMKLGGEQIQEMLVVIHYVTFIILS
jgi:hypothetical protein